MCFLQLFLKMNSKVSIFCAVPYFAVIVDQTIEVTSEFHSTCMIERFIANNFYQNWLTEEFVQLKNVPLSKYQNMPLYDEQLCLRFQIDDLYYIENLYFKFIPGWFITHHANVIYQKKAFVTMFMRNGMSEVKVYLVINHNGHLISIY